MCGVGHDERRDLMRHPAQPRRERAMELLDEDEHVRRRQPPSDERVAQHSQIAHALRILAGSCVLWSEGASVWVRAKGMKRQLRVRCTRSRYQRRIRSLLGTKHTKVRKRRTHE